MSILEASQSIDPDPNSGRNIMLQLTARCHPVWYIFEKDVDGSCRNK